MTSDSVYAVAIRTAAERKARPLRCATCWGRVYVAPDAALFVCEHGHQVPMIAYERWRGDVMEHTRGRSTGLVIGPRRCA